MSDNPHKKKAKARRRGKTPSGSQDAAPTEQGGAAQDGPSQHGKEDVSNVEPIDGGPWPFALGPEPDDSSNTNELPATSDGEPLASLNPEVRKQLVLVKHGHRYVFRYERGEETKVLSGLVDLARDPHSDLDWFDAAVLSHQLGERMSEQLERLRRA